MTADLSQDLQKVIEKYLEGHRSRSLATLSRVSGVAYSTLRRFAQKEGVPTAEPVLKILDATLGTSDKLAFLDRHFPGIARTIAKHTADKPDQEPHAEEIATFYRRNPHNFILNLTINARGTSVETIQRLCGERGLEALDEMVECGVLTRDFATGAVRYKDESIVIADPGILLEQLRQSVDHFDRSLLGTEAARVGHATAAVNRAGLARVHAVVTEALRTIYEINEDPRYAGDIPYYVGALMNIYDKEPFKKESQS
jgi:hypothetical protein